jgi:hypothetical protein
MENSIVYRKDRIFWSAYRSTLIDAGYVNNIFPDNHETEAINPSFGEEYDRDDKIRDVIDDHFNETMGGRKNMTISEFHRTYIEKEFPPPPSDGPGDGSVDQYGDLT